MDETAPGTTDHIVVVEDDQELRAFLVEVLEEAGHAARGYGSADAALRDLRADGPADLIITDLILPGMRGQELLSEVRAQRPELSVVVITAFGSIDSAIEMVKAGAFDYLPKPFGTDELLLTVERALEESRLRREGVRADRELPNRPAGFVGASPVLRELFRVIARAGASRHTALITGESGSGKELVARALHAASGRSPFIALNCAAIPENLLEAELFGHVKGAFSGADRDRKGLVEAAHGGTLFLDEVGELPLVLQPKLLRTIETREVRQVGATAARAVDVRYLAATNRDLEEEVREGRFREDLFWRLNVLPLRVPALRERPADIPLLVEHILGDRPVTAEAMALLTSYPWPGNVRELSNTLERATTMAVADEIRPEDLPVTIREHGRIAAAVADASRRHLPLRDLERAYILEVLRQTGGNKSRTAELLGMDRKTLYRKLEEYRRESEGP
ncbi:MAG: sigma-54 dependent transcriptional regulator [Gemmatimonadota bacterium]